MSLLLVADIGGTNGRFAVADTRAGTVDLAHVQVFDTTAFADLASLVAHYLEGLVDDRPRRGCFAVAGPCDGRRGFMVNRGWEFDAGEVASQVGLDELLLVNDFKALAAGVPLLGPGDTLELHAGQVRAGPIAVIGPGTGLGLAHLVPAGGRLEIVSAEGGYVGFAPGTRQERELLEFLSPAGDYLPLEEVLSGRGLENIHRFLCREQPGVPGLTAAAISAGASEGEPACEATIALFLEVLGSAMGDVALAGGATGGVYLGGGIPPRLAEWIPGSALVERFLSKGPLRPYLEAIPLRLITVEHLALRGAARCLED